jgi:hypothetical protein
MLGCQVVRMVGEHPHLGLVQPAGEHRLEHPGHVGDDLLGEVEFLAGGAFAAGVQRGDLPFGPPAGLGQPPRASGGGAGASPQFA